MKFDKIKIVAAVVALASVAVAGSAVAGDTYHAEVFIDTVASEASGTAYGARTSSNSEEMIHCAVYGYSSGSASVRCFAANAAGVFKECSSSSAGIVNAVQAISDYSAISFSWNAQGTCTSVSVHTGSRFLP
ncbi:MULTISPECIES: hypothetical protein [Sorangium]|uniref:Secreted protein n=1 Tax=Sorangium cellulosum TaxID=56 RepID=A0A4P2QM02_SORCE|nr:MULTISPECIES: hypothetical protein [Sorangium]AUX30866.1 uncharacterized protein SOCE836_029800 [Sorangium cellulosum]WCQ90247.1 hypothetical protein NQZ70_02950 [Sorangium sp. Soce836]